MKKFKAISFLFALVIAFSLVGCGNKAQTTNTNNDKKEDSSAVVKNAATKYFAELPKDANTIQPKDMISKVKAGEQILIVDTRKEADYNKGHLKGAINIPWGAAISQNLDKLPKDKDFYVYCYTGQTAGQTVALLNIAGFKSKSVSLGYDLGIMKAEGAKDVVETTKNEAKKAETLELKPEMKTAVENYFKTMAELKDPFKNYKISEDELKKLVEKKDTSIAVLDIRKADVFAKGHIEGAINIPFEKGMNEKFNTLPKDKKIVVVCNTGQTAGQTTAALRLLGYDAVSLNAGMGTSANTPNGWTNKGYPVVK